jgi:AcrR family transcriptional regulator
VTIEEICREANVSKMTYYKHFPNKIELAKTIYDKVLEESENKFREIMNDDSEIKDKMEQLILLKIEGTNNISKEFLQDFYSGAEPELKAFVEERTRRTWQLLIEDYRSAQKRGILRADFNPLLLIKVQNKMIELLEDEGATSMYASQQEAIIELTRLLIYGIAPRK